MRKVKLIVLVVLCLLSISWGQFQPTREKNLYHVHKISTHAAFVTCENNQMPQAAVSKDFGALVVTCPQ